MPKGMFLPEDEVRWQVGELSLLIDNEEKYYRIKVDMFKNLFRKLKNGNFDSNKAPKLFSYLTEKASREYNNENAPEYYISPRARRIVDKELVNEFLNAVRHKEYD